MIRVFTVLCLLALGVAAAAQDRYELRDRVLGQDFTITLIGVPEPLAGTVAADALEAARRLEHRFDNRQPDGEVAQLNRRGGSRDLSTELRQVLTLCEDWRRQTANAFSCRLGSLLDVWERARETGTLPDRAGLRRQARQLRTAAWPLSERGIELGGLELDLGALAEGYILDQVLAGIRQQAPQATGVRVAIGSNGVYRGNDPGGEPWPVALDAAGLDGGYGMLGLSSRAVAISSADGRRFEIDRRWFSDVIDPENGWPLGVAPAVVVVAPDAAGAVALTSALTVMPVRAGLSLVDRLPDTEAVIVTGSGSTFASQGWYSLVRAGDAQPLWNGNGQFRVHYQIPAHAVAEYRRPYVAAWISDADRQPVRQLLVHGESLRWLREVTFWWRRYGRRHEDAIDGLARPTPVPGRHTLVWDGRDDHGRGVPPGRYTLHVEASRKHGERELVSVDFDLSGDPFEHRARGERELGAVGVSFEAEQHLPPPSDDGKVTER